MIDPLVVPAVPAVPSPSIPALVRRDRPARVPKPAKAITADNATCVHRTSAWCDVEDAQRALNDQMQISAPVMHGWLLHLRARFEGCRSARDVDGSVSAWRALEQQQQAVNAEARRLAHGFSVVPLQPLVVALDAALEAYVAIGGAANRLPGDGGWS